MWTMALGLNSGNGAMVLDAASRMVNTMSEVTELDVEHRAQLIRVVIMAGLRSLAASRGRGDIPNALRLADGAGTSAIILYGMIFGLGGLLQLTSFWRTPLLQVLEVLTAILVTGPMRIMRNSP